jgi:hypothetical protein
MRYSSIGITVDSASDCAVEQTYSLFVLHHDTIEENGDRNTMIMNLSSSIIVLKFSEFKKMFISLLHPSSGMQHTSHPSTKSQS